MRIAYIEHRQARSEECVFLPDAAGSASGNAAEDIVVVLFESTVVADDAFVDEGSELTVKDLPVFNLAALLVRIGHTPLFSRRSSLIHPTTL